MDTARSWTRELVTALALLAFGAALLTAQSATVVAMRDLPRGVALAAADMRGESHAVDAVAGWMTRRTVRAGEPLAPPTIEPPALVTAGRVVTLRVRSAGLALSRPVTALGTGIRGERIRVRIDAQRQLSAIVTGPDEVTLP
ncbi:MAG: flagellar basal body P-ring formation chaperone FlgA [Gemmatimonadaceae bacterium]|nr:flagellar basal body P-ring formation chaperone FlgA [Gemmatimonadaceae bacterium]